MPESNRIAPPRQRRALLEWARSTAEAHLRRASARASPIAPIPGEWGGVFVTLRRAGELRGCRGMISTVTELTSAVREATVLALTDPRFSPDPVTFEELPEIVIEVSILSHPWRTEDPLSLDPGTHGVIVRQGGRSGCFLPKVGAERSWGAATLLSNCCRMKASLDPEAWRQPETEVSLFTADAFAEDDTLGADES